MKKLNKSAFNSVVRLEVVHEVGIFQSQEDFPTGWGSCCYCCLLQMTYCMKIWGDSQLHSPVVCCILWNKNQNDWEYISHLNNWWIWNMILVELFAESAIYQLFSDVFVLDAACSVISSGSFRALFAKYFLCRLMQHFISGNCSACQRVASCIV